MKDFNPLISVIIPTFNRDSVIERAIESVLTQTYKNIELIIVDDGSTDETEKVLSKYKEHPLVKIIKQKNCGVSKSRNNGIEIAFGEYISFLDSDDEWLPKKLESQINFLIEYPEFKWVHTNEIWIRNGVRVNQMKKHGKGGGDQFIPSLQLCAISPSTVMIHKSIFIEVGVFKEDYPVCEDYDLWLRISRKYPIGFVDNPLIKKYGGHDDQLSRKYFAMDYYRVKSIHFVLQENVLDPEKKSKAVEVLLKKTKVLLKGYIKHNNLKNFSEIESISKLYS